MNSRILKKLTKKSEPLLIELGLTKWLDRVILSKGDGAFDSHVIMDRKSLEKWCRNDDTRYYKQLAGTVGYGAMSDYYEPEWSDSDAWSMLRNFVIDSFYDWDNFDYESSRGYPENLCPRKVRKNPRHIFAVAKQLVAEQQTREVQS